MNGLICLLALFAANHDATARERPPNLIFVMADDLGYGDLGCFGQERIQTPRIDQLAREGRRFTSFYAGSTVCAPSRCCLMTGRHTGTARIRGNSRQPLSPEDVTVAEVLREAGYRTRLSGKWGLGEEGSTGIPTRQGFEHFFGYLNQGHAHNYWPEFLWRDEQKQRLRNVIVRKNTHGGVATKKIDYSHDLVTDDALSFVDQHHDEPFFLYLAYTIPHANNEAGKAGMEVPSQGRYAHEEWPEPQRRHAAMISRLDRDVGRLLSRLQRWGIAEDTYVFFTSDNGPHSEGGGDSKFFNSNGPLRGMKRDLYEGGIRVPLIVRGPGVPAGTTCDEPWAFWDVLPTFSELAGATPPEAIDGHSFVNALHGEEQQSHRTLYWAFYERGGSQAIRMGPWKGVARPAHGDLELYHLGRDIGEKKNLAKDHPEIARELRAEMDRSYVASPTWRFPEPKDGN